MIFIHFLISLSYVVLFTALFVLFYYYAVKFFAWLFYFVKNIPKLLLLLLNIEFSEFYNIITKRPIPKLTLKNIWVKRVFLLLLIFNIVLFIQQFIYWNGKGSAYAKAKCYYAAGNVVAMYRSSLAPILSPNNILTFWLEMPQRAIYATAKPLIPQDDGELAIWRYHWFAYPFAKRFKMPHRIYESDWNPLFRNKGEIATVLWEFIKAVDKDNFKDQKMRDEHALRDLPLAVLYLDEMYNHEKVPPSLFVTKEAEEEIAKKPIVYTSWQRMMISGPNKEEGAYYKKSFDKLWLVNQKSYYIATTAYEALKALEDKWQTSKFMSKEIKKYPTLEATRKAAMIAMLHRGILPKQRIIGTLSCNNSYVLKYIELRKNFFEMRSQVHSQLVSNLVHRYIERDMSGNKYKYLFERYCEYKLAGEYKDFKGEGALQFLESNGKEGSWVQKDSEVIQMNQNKSKKGK